MAGEVRENRRALLTPSAGFSSSRQATIWQTTMSGVLMIGSALLLAAAVIALAAAC
jgi:hypothetical protein